MSKHCSEFQVEEMAKILKVSRSGYYDFLKRSVSSRAQYNKELTNKIRAIHTASYETYGSPRVHAELIEQGYNCSRERVARLMKRHKIQAKMYRKLKKTTRQSAIPYYRGKDLVEQNFTALSPNKIWVADISFIPIGNKYAYLAIVLDLFSRKVVGMALRESVKAELVIQALESAIIQRGPNRGLIHHSDLGSQFTSYAFFKKAEGYSVTLSHGKTGCSYDNAAMESFFHTLKL